MSIKSSLSSCHLELILWLFVFHPKKWFLFSSYSHHLTQVTKHVFNFNTRLNRNQLTQVDWNSIWIFTLCVIWRKKIIRQRKKSRFNRHEQAKPTKATHKLIMFCANFTRRLLFDTGHLIFICEYERIAKSSARSSQDLTFWLTNLIKIFT